MESEREREWEGVRDHTDAESTSEFEGKVHVRVTLVLLFRAMQEDREDGIEGHSVHGHEGVSEENEPGLGSEDLAPGWFGFLCCCCCRWTSSVWW